MKRYCIKCRTGKIEYFDIISENDEALLIRLIQIREGNEKVIEETMTRQLFDMCVKTGYIFEMEVPVATVA